MKTRLNTTSKENKKMINEKLKEIVKNILETMPEYATLKTVMFNYECRTGIRGLTYEEIVYVVRALARN